MARIFALLAGIIVLFPLAARGAFAAECEFTDGIRAIAEVKTQAEELKARREVLSEIIACGVREIKTIESNVNGLALPEDGAEVGRAALRAELTEAIRYYEGAKTKMAEAGLNGTKAIAKNLLEWRAIYYLPLSQKAIAFTIWGKNQGLMKAAAERRAEIQKTIERLNVAGNEDIARLSRAASEQMEAALQANEAARRTFFKNYIYEDAVALTRASLEHLIQTYKTFFELSEAVNRVLPNR